MRFRFDQLKSDRWPLICGVAIGILVAFPLAAPLMGGKILEPVATLWGSALGAIAAVSGALWVAERQVSQQRRNAAALVYSLLHGVSFALQELHEVYGPPQRAHPDPTDEEPDVFTPDDWSAVADHAKAVMDEYDALKRRIHRLEAALNMLGPREMETVFFLESEIENAVRDSVGSLLKRSSETGLRFYPGHPSWGARFALMVFNGHVQEYMSQLQKASR